LPLPTRWRAWLGRCWPMGAHIGRLSWPQLRKGLADGRMWVSMCVHELQG
jgi:hypothetical protein